MNLTIIPSDKAVYVDGVVFSGLPISAPSDIHALQWKNGRGWIEFVVDEFDNKPNNLPLQELPAWAQETLPHWESAKLELERHLAELAEQEAEAQRQEALLLEDIAAKEAEVAAWIAANPDIQPV